jgi:hypothetical protein
LRNVKWITEVVLLPAVKAIELKRTSNFFILNRSIIPIQRSEILTACTQNWVFELSTFTINCWILLTDHPITARGETLFLFWFTFFAFMSQGVSFHIKSWGCNIKMSIATATKLVVSRANIRALQDECSRSVVSVEIGSTSHLPALSTALSEPRITHVVWVE